MVEMRILITGVSGFEGSNMALAFRDLGWEITGLDISTSPRESELERIQIVHGDIRDKDLMADLIENVDVVIHLAGQVSHLLSQDDPYLDLDVNGKGILNVLEAVRTRNPGCQVLYSSSRSVYGFPKYLPIDEDHPTRPIDNYGISKLAAEHYCRLYSYHYDVRATVFRQANLFGPRQQVWTNVFQMVSWIFKCLALDEEFTFYGDGAQTRDFLYIDDCVKAYETAIKFPEKVYGQVFNLGGAEYCTWNQLMKYAEEVTGKPCKVKYIPYTPLREKLENPHSWLNSGKYKAATGWFPRVSVKEGFRNMYQYFIEEGNIKKYI